MGWLGFVNWSSVNRRFCALAWIVAAGRNAGIDL